MTAAQAAPATQASPPASLQRLLDQVITPGLCVACGACLGLCPHLLFYDGQVAAPDACGLEGGRCYDLCPQAQEPDQRRKELWQAQGFDFTEPIGPVQDIYWARAMASDLAGRVQYGGVVSALTALALEQGLAGEAVLTTAGARGAPQGVRVRDRAGVLGAAGSIYAAAGTLRELNQALAEQADHPLMVVGLPCQALGAAAMAAHQDYPAAGQRLALVIGLFCTLNLSARGLRKVLAQAGVAGEVTRSDFPPPPSGVFQVTTTAGMTEIPLEQVYQAVLPGCRFCGDLTAEMADLSVGAVEGREGLNTVIVRTDRGRELLDRAVDAGLIELSQPEAESLGHLKQAAAGKRARATEARKEADRG